MVLVTSSRFVSWVGSALVGVLPVDGLDRQGAVPESLRRWRRTGRVLLAGI